MRHVAIQNSSQYYYINCYVKNCFAVRRVLLRYAPRRQLGAAVHAIKASVCKAYESVTVTPNYKLCLTAAFDRAVRSNSCSSMERIICTSNGRQFCKSLYHSCHVIHFKQNIGTVTTCARVARAYSRRDSHS